MAPRLKKGRKDEDEAVRRYTFIMRNATNL